VQLAEPALSHFRGDSPESIRAHNKHSERDYDGLYEITFLDNGITHTMQDSEARDLFGGGEWDEIVMGFAPHIVATQIG
jgi:hypothetical protein